jgi:two-component system, chemotaxis family, response regulator Rcp1
MIQTPSSATPRISGAMRAMPAPSSTPVQILLVEDSPDDADLMIGALKEGRLDVRISLVEDGESALAFLRREGPPGASPRPDLILLDLYLPRKGGHEVLAELKQDPDLRQIPVVILTSSDSEQAFLDAYDLHANCCVSKPTDQAEYAQVVRKIENFWLAVAQRVRRT